MVSCAFKMNTKSFSLHNLKNIFTFEMFFLLVLFVDVAGASGMQNKSNDLSNGDVNETSQNCSDYAKQIVGQIDTNSSLIGRIFYF